MSKDKGSLNVGMVWLRVAVELMLRSAVKAKVGPQVAGGGVPFAVRATILRSPKLRKPQPGTIALPF
jgi:hypothetical protein